MKKPASLTRRRLLENAGKAGLTLAAAQALSPFLFSGGGKEGDPIKVGILHSLTGFMAISEKSLHDAELLAIEEINAKGGVLGRKIEPIVEDAQSNFIDPHALPEKAKKLLLKDKVAAVFGCWTSLSRKIVLPTFENNNGLLFYPLHYEGNECSKNVIYTGAAINQQAIPAVEYLWETMGKRKFYLLGSDYIFPRTVNTIVRALLKEKYKTEPVAEKYTFLGHRDYRDVVDDIKKTQPDVIISSINGDSNIGFYNELAANGITADALPVCALIVDEDDLRGLDPAKVKGHLAAWSYFQSIDTPENKEFVKNFKAKYGKDRVTSDPIEAAYFQVYLWKQAVEKAKSTDVDKVRKALRDLEFRAPGGTVKVDGKNLHTWKKFRMGKIREDRQFDILYESREPLRPDPYPKVAYNKDCDWLKSPQGGVVDIER